MFADTKAFSGLAVSDIEKARSCYGETLEVRSFEEHSLIGLHRSGGRDTVVDEQPGATPASSAILNFESTTSMRPSTRVAFGSSATTVFSRTTGAVPRVGPYIAWFRTRPETCCSVLQER